MRVLNIHAVDPELVKQIFRQVTNVTVASEIPLTKTP